MHRVHRLLTLRLQLVDDAADVVRKARALLRELADLLRHNGEPASGLTGTRRLYRSIECEEVRLVGDALDHRAGLVDLVRALIRLLDDLGNLLGRLEHLLGAAEQIA